VFEGFDDKFVAGIAFQFTNVSFVDDDIIFEEKEIGTMMYFVTTGSVSLVHKSSYTMISEIKVDQHFGEIGFFSYKQ
jgi:CRP-like cAMP-binding protein